MTNADKQTVIEQLHNECCSCIIVNGINRCVCTEKGVKDLYRLVSMKPALLNGAFIADKVVGKGAAALMVLGKVSDIYADVISQSALNLLEEYGIDVEYRLLVPHIINRSQTGICPVEQLCDECKTPEACLVQIDSFINKSGPTT